MATYFSFAIADSMFPSKCTTKREPATVEEIKSAADLISALNPSHQPTIAAMESRYGLTVEIPTVAPKVSLLAGDIMFVMSVRGLPRVEGYSQYTPEQVAAATFAFSKWTVLE